MGVIVEQKEDPAGELNEHLKAPNLLLWRRSAKPKEDMSGNGQRKKTVQAAIPASVSLPTFDLNKNATKRRDKPTVKEEKKRKHSKRDEDKRKRDSDSDARLKRKGCDERVDSGEQMSRSTASVHTSSDLSWGIDGKIFHHKISQESSEEWDDSDALDPPEAPAPIVHEPERVQVTYTTTCLELGTVPSQRYIREVWRQRVVVCHQGLDDKQGKAIGLSLQDNFTVRELHLRDNKLGARGFAHLVDALLLNNTLMLLDVSQNGLGTEGASLLAELIAQDTSLECILVAGNSFGDKAAEFLGDALKTNSRLVELDLSCNLFEDAAGESLGESLAQNGALKLLDLSYNHFRHPGLLALLSSLKHNSGLRSLSLAWSGVDSRLATTLAKSLQDNCCLLSLDLSGCRLNIDAISNLLTHLQGNTSLKTLNVCDNPVPLSENIKLLTKLKQLDSLAVENVYLTGIKMTSELQEMINELQEVKPGFTLTYRIDRTGDQMLMRRIMSGLVNESCDPLEILLDHVHAKGKGIRGLLLSCSNLDNPKVIKRHAFVRGLIDFGIILTMQQVNNLMIMFDPEANWQVEIDHVIAVCKRYRKKACWDMKEEKEEETLLRAIIRASEDENEENDFIEQDLT